MRTLEEIQNHLRAGGNTIDAEVGTILLRALEIGMERYAELLQRHELVTRDPSAMMAVLIREAQEESHEDA